MAKNFIVGKYELDNNQMELLNTNNNSLVIAGAGAGKTLTILGKVFYLIENNICKPEKILMISFTNASVDDIKSRINYNINVLTFHKLAMLVLEIANYKYTLCDSNLLKYIIQEYLINCSIYEQKIILKFLKLNIKYKNFLQSCHYKCLCKLIETFINLYKSNDISSREVLNKHFSNIEKQFLTIIFTIYKIYNSEKESTKKLDFDDLILCATHEVKKTNLNFEYIIIDEFQDTSFIRLNLIKEIYNKTNAKIIVVGDDWQSIYRFSGCDLNIFLNFSKIFPNVNEIILSNTYRNSLELITIASQFIQKNPLQIKKKLISKKRNNLPIVFVPYVNKAKTLKKLLNHLLKISNDIIILGRNNKDIYEYLDIEIAFNNNIIIYTGHQIKFYTVHKSKGLEAEYVIVLNCNNSILGFPNKIENHSIIRKLFVNHEIKFAEERRLFYVAITRCKESVYLIYDKNNPSIFIKEIKKITKYNLKKVSYFK